MPKAKKLTSSDATEFDPLTPAPKSGQVVAHEDLTLLEVSDPADLQALMLDSRVKPFVLAALSSTQAVVLPMHTKLLLEALRKAGHTPKVKSGLVNV